MERQRLDAFLDYWSSVHARTRRVVACITDDVLEWSPAPGRFTCGDTVRHLAAAERWMYAETASGRPSRYPGHGRDLADGIDATVAYYEAMHEEARAILATLDPARLDEKSVTPAGTPVTTWKWLRAMLEHEAHHRGQLYLLLGLRGVPTPPLFGLTEAEVRARSLA